LNQQPPPGVPSGYPPPPANGHAVAALVLGVISLTGCSFITGIPAMILGRMAQREIAESGGLSSGHDLATIGFWLGLVATVIGTLAVLGVLAIFFGFTLVAR